MEMTSDRVKALEERVERLEEAVEGMALAMQLEQSLFQIAGAMFNDVQERVDALDGKGPLGGGHMDPLV